MRRILLILSFLFSLQAVSQTPFIINPYRYAATGGCDADALAFLSAAGLPGEGVIADAVCTLVADLKSNSLWAEFSAIYPFVGGSATTHKFNLKDPDDDDASFRLTFTGSWTHSANGALPDGSTAYANTHLSPTLFGIDDIHLSYYSRTNNTHNGTDMGCYNTGVSLTRILLYTSGSDFSSLNDFVFPTFTPSTTAIYEIVSRINSSDFETYQNGSVVTRSGAAASSSIPNYVIYIGALNNAGTAQEFTNRQVAFATIGTGLTSGQAATLNTIVEAFNDALGRGVQ